MKIGNQTVDEIIIKGDGDELLVTITDDDVISERNLIVEFVARD